MKTWIILLDNDEIIGFTRTPNKALNFIKNWILDSYDPNRFNRIEKIEAAYKENKNCFGIEDMIYAVAIGEIKG